MRTCTPWLILPLFASLLGCPPVRPEAGAGDGAPFLQSGVFYNYEPYWYQYNGQAYEIGRFYVALDADLDCSNLDQWGSLVGASFTQYYQGWIYKGELLDDWREEYVWISGPDCPYSTSSDPDELGRMTCFQADASNVEVTGWRSITEGVVRVDAYSSESVTLRIEDEVAGNRRIRMQHCGSVSSYPYVGVQGGQNVPSGGRDLDRVGSVGLRFR